MANSYFRRLFENYVSQADKSRSDIANKLNISEGTLSRKLNGISPWQERELEKLCEFLKVPAKKREEFIQVGLDKELGKIEKAMEAQEELRGILPDAQIDRMLTSLQAEFSARLAQLVQSEEVTRNELPFIPTPSEVELLPDPRHTARVRYLMQLRKQCEVLPLAALGGEEGIDEELTLNRIYIGLDTTTLVPVMPEEQTGGATARENSPVVSQDEAEVEIQDSPSEIESDEVLVVEEDLPDWLQELAETDRRRLSVLEAATQAKRLVLLGDPGAGKSTFVRNLLAWLAAAQLNEAEPPSGIPDHLLPILVTLRDLTPRLVKLDLKTLPGDRQRELLAGLMRDQILTDLEWLEAGDFAETLKAALASGACLLVLDGLDEVPHDMRQLVRRAVAAVISHYQIERMIVTCRIRSYVGEAVLPKFQSYTLAPFNKEKFRLL